MSLGEGDHAKVGLTISQGVVIAPLQVELYNDVLYSLKNDVLKLIQEKSLNGLLLDLSQLTVIDFEIARQLEQLVKAATLLGAKCRVTGLQPGVVVALMEWDDIWQGIDTALNLDIGLRQLHA